MINQQLLSALQSIAGEAHVSHTAAVLSQHSRDQSAHAPAAPDLVVWPADTAQVSAIAELAAQRAVPLVAWGAGTSLEGNPIPLHGGIVVDFARMNRILAIHHGDFQVTVQPGALYKDMNRELARHGLFFAPDPGANASIGGMVANNAAGTRTVRYGATRDNVLALEVVLADGRILRSGSRSVKQSAGYDLTHLFTGSEGTLGLITEATLRLAPIPQHASAALAAFHTIQEAADAVYGVIGSGIVPAAIELLDSRCMVYLNAQEQFSFEQTPHLLMEFHSATTAALQAELGAVEVICRESGCHSFTPGMGLEARNRLWQARHHLFESMQRAHPGETYRLLDVAVPISAYPELVAYASRLARARAFRGGLFGHAGDGNLHAAFFSAPDDDAQLAALAEFNSAVVHQAITLGGTCTGEHGVGIGKRHYLQTEHDPEALALMRQLKAALDPQNILNPGKIL